MRASSLLAVLALSTTTLLLLPTPCLSWGAVGHSTVALVAQSLLTKASQTSLLSYLSEYAGQLAPIASWADEVRATTEKWNRPLHGTFTPWYAGQYNFYRDCWANRTTSDWLAGCTDGAIQNSTHRLHNLAGVNFTQRVEALKYITHFVGDIAQPLYASPQPRIHPRHGQPPSSPRSSPVLSFVCASPRCVRSVTAASGRTTRATIRWARGTARV